MGSLLSSARVMRGMVSTLCAAIAAAALLSGCGTSVDRSAYIKQNMARLRGVPAFPGSRLIEVDEQGYKNGEEAWATTVGYSTTSEYSISDTVRPSAVIAYYRRALRGRWDLLQVYPGFQLNFRQGEAYLEVWATRGRVELRVDHDCYKGSASPACFGP